MAALSVCFAVLPGAWPADWPEDDDRSGVTACGARVTIEADGRRIAAAHSTRLAPRLAPALLREGAASAADAAAAGADVLAIMLPVGRYDDAVWSPILERLIRRRVAAAGAGGSVLVAWSGLEPFLAAYGADAATLRDDPRLAPAILSAVERSAAALGDVLPEFGAGVRRALALFEPDAIRLTAV